MQHAAPLRAARRRPVGREAPGHRAIENGQEGTDRPGSGPEWAKKGPSDAMPDTVSSARQSDARMRACWRSGRGHYEAERCLSSICRRGIGSGGRELPICSAAKRASSEPRSMALPVNRGRAFRCRDTTRSQSDRAESAPLSPRPRDRRRATRAERRNRKSCSAIRPATEPGWSFAVTPYVWVPWVEGKFSYNVPERTGVAGARVNMDAINLLESLNFAVSIAGEARNGRFSILTDLIYLDFGKSSTAVRSVDFVQAGRNPVSGAVLGRGGADGAQHCWLPTGQPAAGSILVAPGERVRHERAHGRNVAPRAAVARAAVEGTWQPAHRRRPGRAGARAGGRAPRFVRASATFRRPRAMQRQ